MTIIIIPMHPGLTVFTVHMQDLAIIHLTMWVIITIPGMILSGTGLHFTSDFPGDGVVSVGDILTTPTILIIITGTDTTRVTGMVTGMATTMAEDITMIMAIMVIMVIDQTEAVDPIHPRELTVATELQHPKTEPVLILR